MPLYEYECDACGHRFEQIQKFSDPPVEICPKCGSRVHKLVSSPAFQFKGTGWYVTDYAKKDTGGDAKGEKSDKSEKSDKGGEAGAKADAKSESKSETKTESKSDTKTESAKSS
jgi:putative FmdB family regulatory protein